VNKKIFRFITWFFFANGLIFWLLGFDYLKASLSSASLFHNFLIDYTDYVQGKVLVLVFIVTNYFSYMMLLAFLPALLILLAAFILPFKRLIISMSVLIAACSVTFLLVDARIFSLFKFHMNTTVLSFILSPQWREVFDLTSSEFLLIGGAIGVIFIVETVIAWVVWQKIVLAQRRMPGKTMLTCWVGALLFTYFTLMLSIAENNNLFSQQTPNLPLFTQLFSYTIPTAHAEDILRRYSEQKFSQPLFPNAPLRYPLSPLKTKPPEMPYNIILIMVDSLRADSLNASHMPNIANFGAKGWQFQQHLSGGNATQPGLFSLFYSIPSNYWTAVLKQKKKPVFMELLLKYGYTTRVIWSAEMHNPPFHKTIYMNLKNLALDGAPGDDIGNWDRHTTQKAIEFITTYQQDHPFFLHLFYDAPHGFCSYQSFPAPYQPAKENCSRITMNKDMQPLAYYNRYLNAVAFVDKEIGKVLKAMEDKGLLKNSIVIFTSDHGQEFNDNQQNYWGHSGNFTNTQVQVPLIIYWPGEKPKKIDYLTSSYDLVPTLLQRLFSCKNPTADYSIGQNLLTKSDRLPFILAGSYSNMGIIEADRLTTLETSGRVLITDRKAMPLPEAKPRMEVINQALILMRKYFDCKRSEKYTDTAKIKFRKIAPSR
jgi:membrane-anchored protein YejM (alkaline phosphatase superfamily)